jgi:hypothetical protein
MARKHATLKGRHCIARKRTPHGMRCKRYSGPHKSTLSGSRKRRRR